jgi:hypothetical protein
MTIKSNGGVFGRNPSFNNMFATSASVDALTVNGATSLRSNATISSLSGGTRLTIENPAANASNADIRFLASGTGDGVIGFSRAASGLFFNTGGSESARITFGGDLSLLKGNLVVTSGKGIDFSATAGTGTSELFSDYEEGTWTPDFTRSGGGVVTQTSSGSYTKVGNTVHLWFSCVFSGAVTDTFWNTPIPFTPATLFASGAANNQTANTTHSVAPVSLSRLRVYISTEVTTFTGFATIRV